MLHAQKNREQKIFFTISNALQNQKMKPQARCLKKKVQTIKLSKPKHHDKGQHLIFDFENTFSSLIPKKKEQKTNKEKSKSFYLIYKEKQKAEKIKLLNKNKSKSNIFGVTLRHRQSRNSSRKSHEKFNQKSQTKKESMKAPILSWRNESHRKEMKNFRSENLQSTGIECRKCEREKKKIEKIIGFRQTHSNNSDYGEKEVRWRPWSPKQIKDPIVQFMGLETTFI